MTPTMLEIKPQFRFSSQQTIYYTAHTNTHMHNARKRAYRLGITYCWKAVIKGHYIIHCILLYMNIIQSTVTMLSLFSGQSFYTGDTDNCLSI